MRAPRLRIQAFLRKIRIYLKRRAAQTSEITSTPRRANFVGLVSAKICRAILNGARDTDETIPTLTFKLDWLTFHMEEKSILGQPYVTISTIGADQERVIWSTTLHQIQQAARQCLIESGIPAPQ